MKRKKGEIVTLQCMHCKWSTELALGQTAESTVVACTHCGHPIHWHRCEHCGLCYLGEAEPQCPSCDDSAHEELELVVRD